MGGRKTRRSASATITRHRSVAARGSDVESQGEQVSVAGDRGSRGQTGSSARVRAASASRQRASADGVGSYAGLHVAQLQWAGEIGPGHAGIDGKTAGSG